MSTDPASSAAKFDDANYPAYTMGRASEILGVTPTFLRGLDEAGLITPQRSAGGHRRYSRHQLQLAARARRLVDDGIALAAACRIVALEHQLQIAHHRIIELDPSPAAGSAGAPDAPDSAEPSRVASVPASRSAPDDQSATAPDDQSATAPAIDTDPSPAGQCIR